MHTLISFLLMMRLFDNAILYAMHILPIVGIKAVIATAIFKEEVGVRSQLSLK
jgi:hypothetical protein